MRKQNSWKIYSHISRMNKLSPNLPEYREFFSGNLYTSPITNLLARHRLTPETRSRVLSSPIYQGKTPSSREITLSVLLEENKLNQDERDLVVHELRDRMKILSNEQLINLHARYKYELAFIAHATDTTATRLQILSLELRERLTPRIPQKLVTFSNYSARPSSLVNRIEKERKKETRRELKRANLKSVVDRMWDTVLLDMEKSTKSAELKLLIKG